MKKTSVLAVLSTLALATAAATPAMAFENQFSGSFTSFFDLSNYSASGNWGGTDNLEGLKNNGDAQNYFVQRVRLGYTAKASESVKLVTKFELDYNYYGNGSYDVNRGSGAGLGADSINIETKNAYLDLSVTKSVNAKIGMMPYADAFKGVFFDADMAGVLLSHDYSNASINAGFFRFKDSWTKTIGKNTNDMFALDGKYNLSKETKLGAAYYLIYDNTGTDARVHTLGVNGESAVGPLTLSGFALLQGRNHAAPGYTFNLGAKMPLAGGTARAELLYAAGGKNALYVPAGNGGTETGYYNNEMIILGRDKNATTIDNAIVYDTNNYGQGVIFGSIGYDYTFSTKLSGSVNAGFATVAKDSTATKHESNYIGTEINCEANYKLLPEVTLGARAGYVVLGDYFKGKGTDHNPYDIKLIASYSF